jgi:hypothetical protein
MSVDSPSQRVRLLFGRVPLLALVFDYNHSDWWPHFLFLFIQRGEREIGDIILGDERKTLEITREEGRIT